MTIEYSGFDNSTLLSNSNRPPGTKPTSDDTPKPQEKPDAPEKPKPPENVPILESIDDSDLPTDTE